MTDVGARPTSGSTRSATITAATIETLRGDAQTGTATAEPANEPLPAHFPGAHHPGTLLFPDLHGHLNDTLRVYRSTYQDPPAPRVFAARVRSDLRLPRSMRDEPDHVLFAPRS